jgi:hypothetical protein
MFPDSMSEDDDFAVANFKTVYQLQATGETGISDLILTQLN